VTTKTALIMLLSGPKEVSNGWPRSIPKQHDRRARTWPQQRNGLLPDIAHSSKNFVNRTIADSIKLYEPTNVDSKPPEETISPEVNHYTPSLIT
jgi:hypothetical protein